MTGRSLNDGSPTRRRKYSDRGSDRTTRCWSRWKATASLRSVASTMQERSPSITFRRMRGFAASARLCWPRSKLARWNEATGAVGSKAPKRRCVSRQRLCSGWSRRRQIRHELGLPDVKAAQRRRIIAGRRPRQAPRSIAMAASPCIHLSEASLRPLDFLIGDALRPRPGFDGCLAILRDRPLHHPAGHRLPGR